MQMVLIDSAYANLTPVERMFCDKVVRSMCVQAARERVRPQDLIRRPIDPRSLGEDGSELLKRPLVQAAISEKVHEVGSIGAITLDGVMTELWSIIHSNLDDAIVKHPDGWVDWQLDKLSREQMGAFSSLQIEHFPDGKRKIKATLWNKLDAIKEWRELQKELPPTSPLRSLDPSKSGQSPSLPAKLAENEAAEQYAQRLRELAS